MEECHSHENYEFFRSLLNGDMTKVDEMLSRLMVFIDAICPRPVLMSLLIAVMDQAQGKAGAVGGEGKENTTKKRKEVGNEEKQNMPMVVSKAAIELAGPLLFRWATGGLVSARSLNVLHGALELVRRRHNRPRPKRTCDTKVPMDRNQLYIYPQGSLAVGRQASRHCI